MVSNDDFSAINALDLAPIKEKLVHRGGKGWTRRRADAVEQEYRRFLYLVKTFPDAPLAPVVDVDEFWHYHILDTKKYATDCERVFGYFLHHFPYAGMRGKEDEEALQRVGEHTRAMYERTFGERYVANLAAIAEPPRTAFSSAVRLSKAYGGNPLKTAFCYTPDLKKKTDTAFCYTPEQTTQAAFCYTPEQTMQVAFCYTPEQTTQAAFCYTPSPAQKTEAAFCYTPGPEQKTEVAFCYTPGPEQRTEAAFCYADSPKSGADAAFRWSPLERTTGYSGEMKETAVSTGFWRVLEDRAGFFLERPRLPAA